MPPASPQWDGKSKSRPNRQNVGAIHLRFRIPCKKNPASTHEQILFKLIKKIIY